MKKKYIVLAALLGLAAIAFMFYNDVRSHGLSRLHWSTTAWIGLLGGVLCFIAQNLGLIWRYKLLTESVLSWGQCFRVNVLCEFTSAVTPSSVGGSSLIFLYLYKEGINAGRSTTVMMASLFLDELFLFLSCTALAILMPWDVLFGQEMWVNRGTQWVFLGVTGAVGLWTAMLYTALFHRPLWVKSLLTTFFKLPLLKRWQAGVERLCQDLVESSQRLSSLGWRFWMRPLLATACAWCFRFAIVVTLLWGFGGGGDVLLAYVRQWVLWMVAMVSPTPGGSGLSEYMFKVYYADFFPDIPMTLLAALVWRGITYYTYLCLGAVVVPRWLKGVKKP